MTDDLPLHYDYGYFVWMTLWPHSDDHHSFRFDLFRWRYYISTDKNVGMSHGIWERARCWALPFLLLSGLNFIAYYFTRNRKVVFMWAKARSRACAHSKPFYSHFYFVSLNIALFFSSFVRIPICLLTICSSLWKETRWIQYSLFSQRLLVFASAFYACRSADGVGLNIWAYLILWATDDLWSDLFVRFLVSSFYLVAVVISMRTSAQSLLSLSKSDGGKKMMMMSILWRAMMAEPPFRHKIKWRIIHLL